MRGPPRALYLCLLAIALVALMPTMAQAITDVIRVNTSPLIIVRVTTGETVWFETAFINKGGPNFAETGWTRKRVLAELSSTSPKASVANGPLAIVWWRSFSPTAKASTNSMAFIGSVKNPLLAEIILSEHLKLA